MSNVLSHLKDPAWAAAFGFFLLAVFRDTVKEAVTKLFSAVGDLLYRRLAGSWLLRRRALARYRRRLIETTEGIAVPFRPNRPLVLKDIYVALKVVGSGEDESVDVWSLLAHHARIVVTGSPGAGKSMLLRHLAASRSRGGGRMMNRAPLPVLLEMHRLVRSATTGNSIEAHLADAFDRLGFPGAGKFIDAALDKGRLVLLFDGFDEVPTTDERAKIAQRVSDFLARYPECPAIVTCRTAVYHQEFDAVANRIVELEPFQDQQIQAFLRSWAGSMPEGKSPAQLMTALREQPKLLAAARNPLLLTIIAHLYSDIPTYALPGSRAEFYSQAASILLEQWQGHLGQNQFERSEKTTVLSQLALEMQKSSVDADQDRRTISREDAFSQAAKVMPNLGHSADEVNQIMREIVERSGLLISIDGGSRYAFAHLTFQEYFAADALLNQPEALIASFSGDHDSWREVVVLWCGLVADSTTMIEAIEKIDSDVALACVAEARSVDRAVANGILGPVIAGVTSGDADNETRRGLGAVASDIRSRGEWVLDALIEALQGASNPNARLAIAEALSASNRLRAAEELVKGLDRDPRLRTSIVGLGDLAVPSLLGAAHVGGGPVICQCLAEIGTPDAVSALATIMIRGGELQTPAAWGFAAAIGRALETGAEIDLPPVPDQMRRAFESLDWIWEPFAKKDDPLSLSWIVGRAAVLIRMTTDEGLAVAVPDPRISAAVCTLDSWPLDSRIVYGERIMILVDAAQAILPEAGFRWSDGAVETGLDPFASGLRDLQVNWRSRTVKAETYREFLSAVVLLMKSGEEEFAAGEEGVDTFVDALVDALGREGVVWARVMRGLPRGLRTELLRRLAQDPEVNSLSWPSVCARAPVRFKRSREYVVVLAIVGCLSAISLAYGLTLVFEADALDSPSSLFALGACLSIVASWIWMVAASSRGTSAYGKVDDTRVILALLGFIAAPFYVLIGEGEKLSRLFSLVTVGFAPGICWLSVGGISQLASTFWAIPVVVGSLLSVAFLTTFGFARESATETSLLGLFLNASDSSESAVDPDSWRAAYAVAR